MRCIKQRESAGFLCGLPISGGVESGYFFPTSFGLSSDKFETSPFTFKAKKWWQNMRRPIQQSHLCTAESVS
jgi:hypothetical protein